MLAYSVPFAVCFLAETGSVSKEQKQAAADTLKSDSLAILSDQWIAETAEAIRASETDEPAGGWARFLETVKAAA